MSQTMRTMIRGSHLHQVESKGLTRACRSVGSKAWKLVEHGCWGATEQKSSISKQAERTYRICNALY
jgi:hypothetical protein